MAGSVRNMAPNWSGDLSWGRQRGTCESQISQNFGGGGVVTHPLAPADPSREAPLQAGRVQRASQHLAERFLQDVLDHVVVLQPHVPAAPRPRPGQHHHVAAAAGGLKQGSKDGVLKGALGGSERKTVHPPARGTPTAWTPHFRKREHRVGLNWLVKFSSPRPSFPCLPSPKVYSKPPSSTDTRGVVRQQTPAFGARRRSVSGGIYP